MLDVTAIAVRKHIQKLKEKVEKGDADPSSAAPADGTTPKSTPKSTPKKAPKTPTKAAGTKTTTSAPKTTSTKKGIKRGANGDLKDTEVSQDAADGAKEGLKVGKMEEGKRIKLEDGKFLLNEGTEV